MPWVVVLSRVSKVRLGNRLGLKGETVFGSHLAYDSFHRALGAGAGPEPSALTGLHALSWPGSCGAEDSTPNKVSLLNSKPQFVCKVGIQVMPALSSLVGYLRRVVHLTDCGGAEP